MPKPFEFRIQVEEIAVGAVLRRLHELPGVSKIDLDLGHGGTKPATKPNGSGEMQSAVLAALTRGQMTVPELEAATGFDKKRIYGVVHNLKAKDCIKTVGKGIYALAEKAKRGINNANFAAVPRLPAPKSKARMGAGEATLLNCLLRGAARPIAIKAYLSDAGTASPKSLSGIMDRAKRDGLIRKQGNEWALTAKGREKANG